jgi:secretion/DNA translocation related TadE-like protein
MLIVAVMTAVMLVSFGAVFIAGYLVAVHRVRQAADLSALSGATAISRGQDECEKARRAAGANGATVVSCVRSGDQVDFVLTVEAQISVHTPFPGLPNTVRAVAYAGSAP